VEENQTSNTLSMSSFIQCLCRRLYPRVLQVRTSHFHPHRTSSFATANTVRAHHEHTDQVVPSHLFTLSYNYSKRNIQIPE
jgi:hypothetical protein